MVQFWLDNIQFLFSPQNFNFNGVNQSQKQIQTLNITAMSSLLVSLLMVYKKRDPKYFAIGIAVMAFTILIPEKTALKRAVFAFSKDARTFCITIPI